MSGARTIESVFSLINSFARGLATEAARAAARASHGQIVHLRAGELQRLPPDQSFHLVSGRLWLTHHGDDRDHFPTAGAAFDTGSDSVVEALEESVLRLAP